MPRLQLSQRSSFLSTNERNIFLEGHTLLQAPESIRVLTELQLSVAMLVPIAPEH